MYLFICWRAFRALMLYRRCEFISSARVPNTRSEGSGEPLGAFARNSRMQYSRHILFCYAVSLFLAHLDTESAIQLDSCAEKDLLALGRQVFAKPTNPVRMCGKLRIYDDLVPPLEILTAEESASPPVTVSCTRQ